MAGIEGMTPHRGKCTLRHSGWPGGVDTARPEADRPTERTPSPPVGRSGPFKLGDVMTEPLYHLPLLCPHCGKIGLSAEPFVEQFLARLDRQEPQPDEYPCEQCGKTIDLHDYLNGAIYPGISKPHNRATPFDISTMARTPTGPPGPPSGTADPTDRPPTDLSPSVGTDGRTERTGAAANQQAPPTEGEPAADRPIPLSIPRKSSHPILRQRASDIYRAPVACTP